MSTIKSNKFRYSTNNIGKDGKKCKEVYESLASLCHVWASGNVPRGRSGGSMMFENGVIYSYGYHYAVAKIHGDLVLINSEKRSVSSSNHLNKIRDAVKHLSILSVPDVKPENEADHLGNIEYLNSLIIEEFEKILQLKKYSSADHLIELVSILNKYCNHFGIAMNAILDDDCLQLLNEASDLREAKHAAMDVKRAINLQLKDDKIRSDNADKLLSLSDAFPLQLDQWENDLITYSQLQETARIRVTTKGAFGHESRIDLNINLTEYKERIETKCRSIYLKNIQEFKDGQSHRLNIKNNFYVGDLSFDFGSQYAFLRIKDNKVETSQGADVPLDHAIRLLKLILKNEAKQGERVGHHTLSTVISGQPDGDSTINIGCHDILLSEAKSVLGKYIMAGEN